MVHFEPGAVYGLVPYGFNDPQALVGIDDFIADLERIHERLL
jgi:hypothetical protein